MRFATQVPTSRPLMVMRPASIAKKCCSLPPNRHTFGCVSLTLEMPFKDNADAPDEVFGWSPARCRLLGRASLDALYRVIDDLR